MRQCGKNPSSSFGPFWPGPSAGSGTAMLSWFVSQRGSNCRYTLLPSFSLTFHNNPDLIVIELKSIFTWKALQHSSTLLCGLILITTWGHPVWWHWRAQPVLVCESTSWSWAREKISSIWAGECIKKRYNTLSIQISSHIATLCWHSALLSTHSAKCADVLCWSYGSIGSIVDASRTLIKCEDMVR